MASRKSNRLKEKPQNVPCDPPPPPKRCKTAAEATRDWKNRLKENDPKRWEEYAQRGREASRSHRQNASEEQKAKQREQSRLRMQEMRARKKAEKLTKEQPRMTRAAREEMRLKWREAKAKWWSNLHPQKKRRMKEKKANRERERRKANRERQRRATTRVCPAESLSEEVVDSNSNSMPPAIVSTPQQPSTSNNMSLSQRTPVARRKAKQRANTTLPQSPRKRVETLNDLVNGLSSNERQLYQHMQTPSLEYAVGKSVIEELKKTSSKRSINMLRSRRVLLATCQKYTHLRGVSSYLRVSKRSFTSLTASLHTKREQKMEKHIVDFYESVASPVPDKKLVSAKTGQSSSILTKPLRDVYADYVVTQPAEAKQVSFSHFAKCRPRHIRPRQDWRLRQCLCEYCTNVDLKLRALNCMAARIDNSARIRHGYFAIDLLTCGRHDGSWRKECAYRECMQCQGKSLQQHTQQLLQNQRPLTWLKWENQATEVNGKRSVRKMQVRKEGTIVQLVQELEEEVVFLAAHLFRAHWQQTQFNAMRKAAPFPRRTVGMVLDFAENFTCLFQDEIQAAHWYHEQVTVHPIVTYYACPVCGETVSESLVFISDDRCHNFDAVHSFTQLAVDHLHNTRGIQLDHVVQWTDGCSSQYKSKGPFSDISHAMEDFGCTMERNFFGSRHGKGPSDGESAVVKHGASTAVRSGAATITSARDLFEFCYHNRLNIQPDAGECKGHFFRSFFWVPKADIARERNRTVKTLKGTRSLHCVRCIEQNVLCTRTLSCFCAACQSGVGACDNAAVAGNWTRQSLRPHVHCAQTPVAVALPVAPAAVAPAAVAPVAVAPVAVAPADVAPVAVAPVAVAPVAVAPAAVAPVAVAPVAVAPVAVAPAPVAPAAVTDPDNAATLREPVVPSAVVPNIFVKVAMKTDGRQRKLQHYYAKVLKVEDDDIHVRFLVEKAAGHHVWADEAWVVFDQIEKIVQPPQLAPTRGLAFIF